MSLEEFFRLANLSALAGWVLLVFSPLLGRWAVRLAGYAIPLVLSALYAGFVLAFWSRSDGSFGSLAEVMRLLSKPEIALAGWIHYLAFDLFIGGWQVRNAQSVRIPHPLVLPCLALTFLFGPAGLLAFLTLRAAHRFSQGCSLSVVTRSN